MSALTLVTGLQRVHTCTRSSTAEQLDAILIGGPQVVGLLPAPQAAALAAAVPSLTQLDATGLRLCCMTGAFNRFRLLAGS